MGGYARLLERSEMGEDERRQAVTGILEEIGAIEAVLAECLDYVRPRPVRRGPVALGPLVQEVARAVTAAEPEAAVVAEGDGEVAGDREQLRQALVNVVRNAVQASPAGVEVRIEVRDHGEAAEIAVVDGGRGMSEEELERLCDPFFTTRAAGTGLGMSIVTRIVAAHGGQLEVVSTVGEGSAVRLRLPVEAV
jgi:signal transduction histidine kinase